MNAEALVIELDTPGGLDTSMRSIVKDIIGSSVPVVVYVSPNGARAASAVHTNTNKQKWDGSI